MRSKVFVIILSIAFSALTAEVKLEWDANAPGEGPLEYRLYTTTNVAEPLTDWVFLAATTETNIAINIVPGQWFFVLTASNFWGESGPSNIASTPDPATDTTGLTIKKL